MKRALETILEDQRELEADVMLRAQIEQEERVAEVARRRRAAEDAQAAKYRSWVTRYDEMGLVSLGSGAAVSPPSVTPQLGMSCRPVLPQLSSPTACFFTIPRIYARRCFTDPCDQQEIDCVGRFSRLPP